MANKKKTPAGVTLEDLLKTFKQQNMEIPTSVKEIMNPTKTETKSPTKPIEKIKEKPVEKAKVKTATRETKNKELTEDELYDRAVALVQKEGKMDDRILAFRLSISRVLAKKLIERMSDEGLIDRKQTKAETAVHNFVGKNVASKLIKKQPEEEPIKTQAPINVPIPQPKPSVTQITNNADLKIIRANIDEIHQFLLGQKKPLGPAMPRTNKSSSFFKSFLGGLTNKGFAEKFFPSPKLPKYERTKPEKKESAVQRIPMENAPAEITKLQSNLFQDQQTAQHTKEFVQQEDDAKTNREKLDKIQASLDEMKKKLDTLLGRKSSNGGLLGTLANLWNLLKMAWGAIKLIGKNVARVFREIGKVTAWIASRTWGLIKKGVEKLAPLLERFGPALAEFLVTKIGPVAATGAIAYATDRIAKYEYDRAAAPFKQLEQDYGLKALGNGNFEIGGKKYHNYGDSEIHGADDLPEQYKTLIEAKTGDVRGGTSKRAQKYVSEHQAEFDALRIKPTQPQKPIPTALTQATKENIDLESDMDSEPQVIVVKGGNKTTVLPASNPTPAVVVSPRNPDLSADALNGDLFDLPQGYGALGRL